MKSKGIFTRILSAILCAIMVIGMVPVAIAAEEDIIVGKIDGKDLKVSWGAFYTDSSSNPTNKIVENSRVVTASNNWQHDGNCANFTIENIPVAEGVNGNAEEAPNHLNLDIKIATRDAKYTVIGSVLVTAGTKSRSYDIDFSSSKAGVTRYQLNISNFGEIDKIDSIQLMPFVKNGGQLRETEVIIDSISYGYKYLEPVTPIVYPASSLQVGIADPTTNGLANKWTSEYDYERGLWVVNFTEDINKEATVDGDRIYVKFPTVSHDAKVPYVVVGIQVPSTTDSSDFNVYYGESKRTYNASNQGSDIGKTEIGKQIFYLANDTTNYGNESITGIASNAWGQGAFSASKGEGAYVQYVAFFETLDEAKEFVYEDPHNMGVALDDGDESTEVDAVAFSGADLDAITNAGTLTTDETGTYLSIGKIATFDIKPTAEYLPTSGAGSWFDYQYHVFEYSATGINTDGFDPRSDIYYTFGTQDLKNTDGEIILQTIDLSLFEDGKGCPITSEWTNPLYRITQCNNDNADLKLYSIASFRTLEQAEAYKHAYARKEITANAAEIALEDGTARIVIGGTKEYDYEVTGRNDGFRVVSDATVKSVEYTVDNGNATITADGEIKGIAAGTATVTATITLTTDDVITATADVEIKANPEPTAIFLGERITAKGGNALASLTSEKQINGNLVITLPAFTGDDNNRLYLRLPDGGVTKAAHYIAYAVRVENAKDTTDVLNVLATSEGTEFRLYDWEIPEQTNHVYSGDEIKKFVTDASAFKHGDKEGGWSHVTDDDKITGIVINAWNEGNPKPVISAGSQIEVQYIAFFNNREDAEDFLYIAPNIVEITVSATEGGSVIGESGKYAVDSTVTFTATPKDDYIFDGWYLKNGNTLVSTNATYELTVSEAIALEARFVLSTGKTLTRLQVETVRDDTLGSVEIDDENYTHGFAAPGTAVTLKATANAGKFAYWKRVTTSSGVSVYLGINESLDAYALGTGVLYQPVFFDADAPKATIYVDATNKILTDDGTTPANPEMPGYKFDGWVDIVNNDIVEVMAPKFTAQFNKKVGLKVIKANGQEEDIEPSFNQQLNINAGEDDVVWTLEIDGKYYHVSYNKEYSFRYRITAPSATLTATHTDEEPKALVSGIEAVRVGDATRFVGTYYVPAEYTVIGYGMLLTSNATLAEDMDIGTNGIIVGNLATSNNPDYQMFIVDKNKTTDQTWYGKAFLIYSADGGATSTVIYGDTISM